MGQVLSVSEIRKRYDVRKTAFSYAKEAIHAIDGISFAVDRGETLGVVGESGSGKSTLARCLLYLEKADSGEITFLGNDLNAMNSGGLRRLRREMQIIFQDPYSSLNPRKKVSEALVEPILFHNIVKKDYAMEKVLEVLKNVGLSNDFLGKYPHEMSGGQRQRVAIGRALTTNPSLIVADEPVSSLDVSIQAQIINLFMDIKESKDISIIFISHDLNVVRFVSDAIIVMYKGRIVEMGQRDEVFYNPLHPYTKMLIDSVKGELTRRLEDYVQALDTGCPYYTRCHEKEDQCIKETPQLFGSNSHRVACFLEKSR